MQYSAVRTELVPVRTGIGVLYDTVLYGTVGMSEDALADATVAFYRRFVVL